MPNSILSKEAVGVGLRPAWMAQAREETCEVEWFEAIAENYLGTGPIPQANLATVAHHHPVTLHGVSLDLLGSDPLDLEHLAGVDQLAKSIGAPCFSDHLCWTRLGDWHSHDLLPTPFTTEFAEHAARRARTVQEHLSVPFGIENLSSYAAFATSTLSEWEFYAQVVREARVWMMLDLNNIFVSSQNHGFDPHLYLEAIDWDRVLYVHLAGHTVRPDGLRIDTHDAPVCPEVWDLYRDAWIVGGPFPTLIEWDAQFPTWERLVQETHTARRVRTEKPHASLEVAIHA